MTAADDVMTCSGGRADVQSCEAAVNDPSVLRNIESQVPLLGQPDLRTLHTRIGQQLQQSQQ